MSDDSSSSNPNMAIYPLTSSDDTSSIENVSINSGSSSDDTSSIENVSINSSSSSDPNMAIHPLSSSDNDEPSSIEDVNSVQKTRTECFEAVLRVNEKLYKQILKMETRISDLKDKLLVSESKVKELTLVSHGSRSAINNQSTPKTVETESNISVKAEIDQEIESEITRPLNPDSDANPTWSEICSDEENWFIEQFPDYNVPDESFGA